MAKAILLGSAGMAGMGVLELNIIAHGFRSSNTAHNVWQCMGPQVMVLSMGCSHTSLSLIPVLHLQHKWKTFEYMVWESTGSSAVESFRRCVYECRSRQRAPVCENQFIHHCSDCLSVNTVYCELCAKPNQHYQQVVSISIAYDLIIYSLI